tara:strand:+ start:228 stop:599 length:372 start_codon:yes stop_codon:yes gene_type:complete
VPYGGRFVVREPTGAVLGYAGLYKLIGVIIPHPCANVVTWDVFKLGPLCHVTRPALGDCAVVVIAAVFAFGPEVRAIHRGLYLLGDPAFGYCVQAVTASLDSACAGGLIFALDAVYAVVTPSA